MTTREAARKRRDKGITDSILHADRAARDWPDTAYSYLLRFAATEPEPWTAEQFREWAKAKGLPNPPDLRAFGGVVFRAKRLGMIRRVGVAPATSSNLSLKPRYLSGIDRDIKRAAPAKPIGRKH